MQFQVTDRFSKCDDVLSQEVLGETILLNLEGETYFGLNEVGTRIWQLIQSGQNIAETLQALSDEYDVGMEQLESDVDKLLINLTEAGLVNLLSD